MCLGDIRVFWADITSPEWQKPKKAVVDAAHTISLPAGTSLESQAALIFHRIDGVVGSQGCAL